MSKDTDFPFDVKSPLKSGVYRKSGKGKRIRFKTRFFVLYSGYLVYYDTREKWQVDCAVGSTLSSRLGAIKLNDCRVSIPPDGGIDAAKYPFALHCPDPSNKRPYYFMDCSKKDERTSWVEAIDAAAPRSAVKD